MVDGMAFLCLSVIFGDCSEFKSILCLLLHLFYVDNVFKHAIYIYNFFTGLNTILICYEWCRYVDI